MTAAQASVPLRSTFVALPVGERVRTTLAACLGDLPRRWDDRAAWTRPAGWHVTLAYLGRVEQDRAGVAAAAVRTVLAAQRPAPGGLVLGAPVRLGRAVALAVETPDDRLADLRTGVVAACEGVDLAVVDAERRFRPHLTLARVRRGSSPEPLRRAVAAAWPGPLAWSPRAVAVMMGIRGDGPSHYRVLDEVPLPGDARET